MEILRHDKQRLDFFGAVLEALVVELVLDDKDDLLAGQTESEVTSDHFFHDDQRLELQLLGRKLM